MKREREGGEDEIGRKRGRKRERRERRERERKKENKIIVHRIPGEQND